MAVWQNINNILGLIGLLLGIISLLFAYWAWRLTKRSFEVILEIFDHKAYVVKIKNSYYLFAQIVMRNLGGAWFKLIALKRTGAQIKIGSKILNFTFMPNILSKETWPTAQKIFNYAINLERINHNPEITLYPNGASVEFYFIGKTEDDVGRFLSQLNNAFLDIDYEYETERGILKHRGVRVARDLIWTPGPSSVRSFTITIPVIYEENEQIVKR